LVADQEHGLHQCARDIAKQDPIDGVVDVGTQAGAIQKSAFQIHRFGQVQFLRGSTCHAQQLLHHLAHLGLGPPLFIALEGALAGHGDAEHLADAAEVLEQGAIGQAGSEATKVLLEQDSGEVAAQSAATVELPVLLSLGAGVLALGKPALQILLHQLGFQAAVAQQLSDAQELLAQEAVIDIALDGGQDLRQERFKRDNRGIGHEASLYSSLKNANIKS